MKSFIFFFTVLFAFTTSVHGSFNASNLMSKLPAMGSMISAQDNTSIYIFGGANDTIPYGNELYKLTLINRTYNWEILPQKNAPNGTINGRGYISIDALTGKNFIIMGGRTESNKNSVLNMQIYSYNFESQTWTANANNNAAVSKNDTSILFNREAFSASYRELMNEIYVLGGALLDGNTIFADFRKLDKNFKVTTLSTPNVGRYGHTATYTGYYGHDNIVILGGITREHTDPVNSAVTMDGSTLADMQKAWVYDIPNDRWETVTLHPDPDNGYPRSRVGHTAVLSEDPSPDLSASTYGDIIIFGGNHGIPGGDNQYLNDIAILNTFTWTWTIPNYSGTPPSNRSDAVIGLLENNMLTVAFGESSNNTYYNDINVYDWSNKFWLQNFGDSPPDVSSGVSNGLIAGVTVAGVVVLFIIIFVLWQFKFCSGVVSSKQNQAFKYEN